MRGIKFGGKEADTRHAARQYNNSNRADWAALGFRHMTYFVHDDERELILAELDLRKCIAMVAMAENSKTDPEKVRLLSRRNMSPVPLARDLQELEAEIKKSTAATTLGVMLDIARNYLKRYRNVEGAYSRSENNGTKVRLTAKAVAYSGACTAQLRLLRATLAFEPLKETSIFGINPTGDDDE